MLNQMLMFSGTTLIAEPISFLPTDLHKKRQKDDLITGDCVVCAAPNSGFHFGCIACAACSAFFRRTIALRRQYHCRRDPSRKTKCPLDRRHRSNCKACRFTRCLEMGMNPSGVQNLRDPIRSASSDVEVCEEEEPNMVEALLEVYQNANERRKMFYCDGSLSDILSGVGMKPRPTRFDERYYKDKMRFELIIYIEMMKSMKPFRSMDLQTQEALIKSCALSLAVVEKYYSSVKLNGLETQRITAPDGSYTDLSDNGAQYDDEAFNVQGWDKKTCINILYDPLKAVLKELGGALKYATMGDVEFLGLFAILVFNTGADISDEIRLEVFEARNRFMRDWFDYYEKIGVSLEEAGNLVGNTILLLTPVRNALRVHSENYHMVRVFNVMTYDKLLDDLVINK